MSRATTPTAGARPDRAQSRAWFVVGAVVVSLVNLASSRLSSDGLDGRDAADLRSLVGALAAVSLMALGMQLVLVGILTDRESADVRRPPTNAPVILAAAVAGLAGAAAAVVLIQSSQGFEARAAVAVAAAVAALVIAVPARSVLLGDERWRDLAAITVVGGVVRLAITAAGNGSNAFGAALVGIVAGEVVTAALAVTVTRRTPRVARWPRGTARHLRIGTAASVGLMFVIVVSSLSTERFLGDASDVFNQSAAVARYVFVLLFTVAFVFFPAMARAPIGSAILQRSFHLAMIVTTTVAVVAVGVVLVAPSAVAELVNGGDDVSVTTVRVLAVAFGCYGIAVVSLMQYVAHGSRLALCTWPIGLIMVAGQLIADRPETLALFALATAVLLVLAVSMPALVRVQPVLRPDIVEHPVHDEAVARAVTIVVPSYNAGPTVVATAHAIVDAFAGADARVHVVVVSDGSTDGSADLVDAVTDERITHVRHAANRGKGAALRTGFAQARTPVVGFVDADGDLPPVQLVEMARILQETGADIVFGSKRHAASTVSVPLIRRVYSRTFQVLIRQLFQLDIADTQTGIKVYSRDVLDAILPLLVEDGFALDLEMFVAARAAGFGHFVEVPVELRRQQGSTVSSRSAFRMLLHTLGIFWRAKVMLRYLRAAAGLSRPTGPRPEAATTA